MHSDMGNSDSCQPQDLQDVGFGAQRNTNLDLELAQCQHRSERNIVGTVGFEVNILIEEHPISPWNKC